VNGAPRRGMAWLRLQVRVTHLGIALSRGRAGRDDHGATSVEYALMVGLIAVVIVASVTLFGQNAVNLFNVPSSAFNP